MAGINNGHKPRAFEVGIEAENIIILCLFFRSFNIFYD